MEPYRDSVEHLTAELQRLDLLVRRMLVIARADDGTRGDAREFRGLVISEPEIDKLVESGEFLRQHWRKQEVARETLEPIDQKALNVRESIDERRNATQKAGRRLTLPYLAERFGLSAAEVDLLLIALAPELESRYEILYSYLQDDVTRKRPSVDLALNLICRNEREKVFARRFLAPGGPLVHFHMIELIEESHDRQATLLRKFVKIEDSLLRFLLEQAPTALLLGTFVAPRSTIETLEVDEDTRTGLENLAQVLRRTGMGNTIVRVIGSGRAELNATAEAIGHALHRTLITVDLSTLETATADVNAMIRDAALLDAAVVVFDMNAAVSAEEESKRNPQPGKQFWSSLDRLPGPLIALGPETAFPELPQEAHIWKVELATPSFDQRQRAWESVLNGTTTDADPARLADTFRFGGAQIRQVSALACSLAAMRNPSNPTPSMADLLAAGRSVSGSNLRRFASVIQPRYGWDDIVLPRDKRQQLEHIAARVEYRRMVHRDWGFGEKLSRGKGLTILFTGPSGVGKTMAAEVLANALSLVLFQIDLSSVVSKYIGETEKHLSAIFREAEMSNSLLFFDEADSLFGKRTEVKDAHDRYANLEVSYLLQCVEQYEGVVVLATNLQRSLDEAFLRRIHEMVDFPFPDEDLREKIWQQHLPTSAPVEADIDFRFLARQFKLTGGSIKNAVMTAAFLAASRNKRIGMEEMVRGVGMEVQKQGKLVMKSDFGRYFETIHPPAGKAS